jgi:hypothetical protein
MDMDDTSRKDIRRILKTFGIGADEALVAHLARNPNLAGIRVRLTLEDITEYGDFTPPQPLKFVVEDKISRTG